MPTKNKIAYGKVEIPESAFEPKNVKERITIFLDEDVVNAFRARAELTGEKYQTLINQALRDLVFRNETPEPAARLTDSDLEVLQKLMLHSPALIAIAEEAEEKKRA